MQWWLEKITKTPYANVLYIYIELALDERNEKKNQQNKTNTNNECQRARLSRVKPTLI